VFLPSWDWQAKLSPQQLSPVESTAEADHELALADSPDAEKDQQ
jgi:hypothetical protein